MAGIAENTIVMIILSIFLPPLAVFFKDGAGTQLIINILLWIFTFGLGGIIHALWRVFRLAGPGWLSTQVLDEPPSRGRFFAFVD